MSNQGYINLHRSLLSWEWYSDVNTSRLFVHLILKVNYNEKKWQGKLVKKGQLITSVAKLSYETNLTAKQVRIALDKLKRTNEVAIKTTSQYTMIYVQNYIKYQEVEHCDGIRQGKPTANEGQTKGKPTATTKEGKERKKEEEDIHTKKNIKKKFLDFVYLHDSEYQKLVDEYGEAFTERCIKKLDLTIPNRKEGPYKDCYRAILNWVVEAVQKADSSKKKTEKISLRYGKEVKETGLMNDFLDAQKYLKED